MLCSSACYIHHHHHHVELNTVLSNSKHIFKLIILYLIVQYFFFILPNPKMIPSDRNNLSDQINLKSIIIELNTNIQNPLEEENKKVRNLLNLKKIKQYLKYNDLQIFI